MRSSMVSSSKRRRPPSTASLNHESDACSAPSIDDPASKGSAIELQVGILFGDDDDEA